MTTMGKQSITLPFFGDSLLDLVRKSYIAVHSYQLGVPVVNLNGNPGLEEQFIPQSYFDQWLASGFSAFRFLTKSRETL